jgi:alpha-1,3-glucosyltransferase
MAMALEETGGASLTTTPNHGWSLPIGVISMVVLVRVALGYQPYSGMENYHGSHAEGTYGGDYEAQRHWMELTYHLPVSQWYYYDLHYWGLDYPPLTAYVSYLCGMASHHLVGPASVALYVSRGFEDPTHKAFMRTTVLVLDLLCYGTAVYRITRPVHQPHSVASLSRFLIAMLQPSILLIDHGHFQYNTVALGLSLWSFYFVTRESSLAGAANEGSNIYGISVTSAVSGSVLFCAALSFKQMTLYYAPAIFFFLLGWCCCHLFPSPNVVASPAVKDESLRSSTSPAVTTFLSRLFILGGTVASVMALIWWPLIAYGPSDTTYRQRLYHLFRRIIPLQRGLFENKVANIWFVLSIHPFRIRDRIPAPLQPIAALSLTILFISPFCYKLFTTGRQQAGPSEVNGAKKLREMLWGSSGTALSFFLASFQVHEKSILLAVAPISLLRDDDPTFVTWFSIVATWSLWPLLVLDRLRVAYVGILVIYVISLDVYDQLLLPDRTGREPGFFDGSMWKFLNLSGSLVPRLSYLIMGLLHLAECFIEPPPRLPDLYPVLWSVFACGCFIVAYTGACWHLFKKDQGSKPYHDSASAPKDSQKKKTR